MWWSLERSWPCHMDCECGGHHCHQCHMNCECGDHQLGPCPAILVVNVAVISLDLALSYEL